MPQSLFFRHAHAESTLVTRKSRTASLAFEVTSSTTRFATRLINATYFALATFVCTLC